MKEILITKNDAGQRIDRFLLKTFPLLKQGYICSAIRKKRIKHNNIRCKPNDILAENDKLQLYINDELLERKPAYHLKKRTSIPLSILYEDSNILLLDKKPGITVHEANDESESTLIDALLMYLEEKGEYQPNKEQSFVPALCNRLDRNTGGIVIAAKNAEALRIMNEKVKKREITKLYLCVTVGRPPKNADSLTAYLEKNTDQNRVYISNTPKKNALTIKTDYRILDTFGEQSLLEVNLLTGRTHQIRAHLAFIGTPIAGDGKYGKNTINKSMGYPYQALYSYKLVFSFQSDAGALNYLKGMSFTVPDVWFLEKYYKAKAVYERKDS